MARFEPEFGSDSETPSPDFAEARLSKTLKEYYTSVRNVHEECRTRGISSDPDRVILQVGHSFFGKADGVPLLYMYITCAYTT